MRPKSRRQRFLEWLIDGVSPGLTSVKTASVMIYAHPGVMKKIMPSNQNPVGRIDREAGLYILRFDGPMYLTEGDSLEIVWDPEDGIDV